MEDYNTATLPSKKYYDLNKWNIRCERKKAKLALKDAKRKRRSEMIDFNDEEARRLERVAKKQEEEALEHRLHLQELRRKRDEQKRGALLKVMSSAL